MCMCFGYNPCINFCHFFHFVNFIIFRPQILWKCIDSGYFVSTTLYTISCLSLCNFAHLFSIFHGLKMCMWFGFKSVVNFWHFSTLLFFNFPHVQHQLHRSSNCIVGFAMIQLICFSRWPWPYSFAGPGVYNSWWQDRERKRLLWWVSTDVQKSRVLSLDCSIGFQWTDLWQNTCGWQRPGTGLCVVSW